MLMAIGEAIDVANDLRKAAAAARQGVRHFGGGVRRGRTQPRRIEDKHHGRAGAGDNRCFSRTPRRLHRRRGRLHGELGRRAMLRRLWAGG